jgi:hypothetical protein
MSLESVPVRQTRLSRADNGATLPQRRRPFSRACRPFIGPILKGAQGGNDLFVEPSGNVCFLRQADLGHETENFRFGLETQQIRR